MSTDLIPVSPTPKKGPKLPRRPRLRDYPTRGARFDVQIVGELPAWVEPTAELMRHCWNDMCGEMRRALAAVPEPPKTENGEQTSEEIKAVALEHFKAKSEAVKPFKDLKGLRAIAQKYGGKLPATCYYAVVDRFLKTMQE